MRPFPATDLVARRVPWRGESSWVLHNPVSGRYARIHPRLYLLMGRLDGRRSVGDAIAGLPDAGPGEPEANEMLAGIGGLLRLGLLRQPGGRPPPPAGILPLRRLIYWPVELGDLAPALPVARMVLGPLFTPFGIVLWLAALGGAIALWLPRRAEAEASFAALAAFAPLDALSLFLLFGVLKLVHELGHAICAQKMAAQEGHHIGIFRWGVGLMFLMPAPWINVSGTWFVASRWRRAAVGMAGIWVDLFLASVATILWAFAEPGWMHELLFRIALVCGVSSLLFNANPLVRLDGYYVMSDLLEITSLQGRANAALQAIGGTLVGLSSLPRAPGDWGAALWGVASFCYRMTVFAGVFWMALSWHWLLAAGVVALVFTLYIGLPLVRILRASLGGGRRAIPAAALALGLLACAALVPLPDWVVAEGVVERQGTNGVFAQADGIVEQVAPAGPASGALLLRLHGAETLRAVAQLELERAGLTIEARQAASSEPARIGAVAARRAALEAQLLTLQAEIRAWDVRAPDVPGMVWVPERAEGLAGAWVRRDDQRPLGHAIATEGEVLLRVILSQRVAPQVLAALRPGGAVPVRAHGDGPAAFSAHLEQVRPHARAELPSQALAAAAAAAAGRAASDPAERIFELDLVPSPGQDVRWLHGQRVEARLPLPDSPLAMQLWRRVRLALEPRMTA